MEKILARTTEEGSRQLVYAAIAGEGDKEAETRLRGAYVSLAAVEEPSDIVLGEKGLWAQDKLWVRFIESGVQFSELCSWSLSLGGFDQTLERH